MRPSDTVWVVIAAYNEAEVIGSVVGKLRREYPNVIVVDDGSSDETSREAERAGATIVRHPINLGQGAALQTGTSASLRAGAGYIVTFDADGQHDPADIQSLLEALNKTGADVAIGNRFSGSTSGMPFFRRVILRLAALFTRLTTGIDVSDPHNGLRALTADAARRIEIKQNRMAHASEIIAKIGDRGLQYVEVPVKVRYTDYSRSKGQKGLDAVNILVDLMTGRINR